MFIYFLSGNDFDGPNLVLEGIVLVCLLDTQRRVGISWPSPAEVEAFKYPADPVFPADLQRCRVIFAIADVQKTDVAHHAGVEGPWGAQTIYA